MCFGLSGGNVRQQWWLGGELSIMYTLSTGHLQGDQRGAPELLLLQLCCRDSKRSWSHILLRVPRGLLLRLLSRLLHVMSSRQLLNISFFVFLCTVREGTIFPDSGRNLISHMPLLPTGNLFRNHWCFSLHIVPIGNILLLCGRTINMVLQLVLSWYRFTTRKH